MTIIDDLHHTDDPLRVLAECGRVARRGVVIKDHLREGLAAFSTLRIMDWVGNRGHDLRLPCNHLSKAECSALFRQFGVSPVTWKETLGLYPPPFTLAFERGLHFVATVRQVVH